ncbi:reverse transcriptase domain protein [Lasallia pustulata]|uniref:Reverse transcriptase domain protein n=1 Tax=Lasallia pustulata TaxID=136370 RepID=A0A1W5D6N8_9LECA|nr:reverse transcriptase domain protein [Lasallia pustulata]
MTTAELADLFIQHVYKLYGLPDCIVSDRGNLFVAEFWKAVCTRLCVDLSLLLSYHLETNGQTEISNAFAAQYLQMYVDFTQKDWEDWLALAEFAANNVYNKATKMSPFFANSAQHPRMSFGPPRPPPLHASAMIRKANELGNNFVNQMEEILGILKENIINANARYEEQTNQNRTPAPAYRVGDLVFLSTRNIDSPRPAKKLDNKYLGPLKIKSPLGTHAYRLELPDELQSFDNSFHTSLLQPAPENVFPGQNLVQDTGTTIMVDDYGEKLWAIDKLLNCRRHKGVYQYQVKWRSTEEVTWEPLKNVVFASKAIREFEEEFLAKRDLQRRI